eukprot:Protomagalhaensia_sp_Gyna_25__53@NODE_1025_length_2272_cov_35_005374_g817_i0_p1_GENE_NODE_1025_length_2272_cov_35_005374_g817_i0NODE_1025_length_2272_cov_35_005374_g817_i0_p1_ORF_typecomplete_len726_score151_87NOG1_N/PF17835_1/1e66NOG1/PF06858_14/5_7e26FeoB_N/PF02421_18/2_1e24FeoB_N/PF02421_18/8_6e03NOGCT/PF08155_11/1_6e22MMR_HSR1/PF01926_23/8_9e18Ras/PF00071_22/3_7e03Ras/PF00071_22/3_5e07AIG1/PF04548_16/9_1e07Arf/PF00025_21/4_7e06GTP_EFTU/PF00009_27/0_00015MnmE_helical/PF12631_7/4_9e05RsgA_GTPa
MSGRNAADQSHQYRFKAITTVPNTKELIDICLSRTQRKTPTQVHPQYAIGRIREFYMRKVKFCQQTFHDKFTTMLDEFPRLDDIHPFYSNLLNVLYDKDHYKLALGQVNAVRGVVDTIGKEYVKLLKYADSAYKCKMLKRAALGRMCTTVKKLNKVLTYLEEVRQHLGRLPGINPYARTLLLAGHPNVGKSTYMNAVSNANVEVEPFPFTTRAPYVGHFDYDYQSWQVVDTPGILDRPLTSRNAVEMTAITALAYLNCAILFLVDISEQCGYNIEEQVKLFHATKDLFKNKPILVVCNKVDLRPQTDLTVEEIQLIKSMEEGVEHVRFTYCSTLAQINLDESKNEACRMLIDLQRAKAMLQGKTVITGAGIEQLYVPAVAPAEDRPPFIPPSVKSRRKRTAAQRELDETVGDVEMEDGRMLEQDLQELYGGAGVYDIDDRKHWDLENEEWAYDQLPEFYDGKNIADFIDPDIEEKLRELEAEEAAIEAAWNPNQQAPTEEWFVHQELLRQVYHEIEKAKLVRKMKKKPGSIRRPMSLDDIKSRLEKLGIDPTGIVSKLSTSAATRAYQDVDSKHLSIVNEQPPKALTAEEKAERRGRDSTPRTLDEAVSGKVRTLSKRSRTVVNPKVAETNLDVEQFAIRKLRALSLLRRRDAVGEKARSTSLLPTPRGILYNPRLQKVADRLRLRSEKRFKWTDHKNEADRSIPDRKPKHLYSGKRGIGKSDWR